MKRLLTKHNTEISTHIEFCDKVEFFDKGRKTKDRKVLSTIPKLERANNLVSCSWSRFSSLKPHPFGSLSAAILVEIGTRLRGEFSGDNSRNEEERHND